MIAAMLGTILPDLSDRFHLTPSQNGTIAFAQALGLIIASLAVGPLLDNEGKKVGIILGLVVICHCALRPCRAHRASAASCFCLFLLGVGGGILVTGANALVSDVSETHRATALNLANLFFGLGALSHTLHRRQSFREEMGPPLLHHRVAHGRHAGD
jgi:fucose permease